MNYLIWANIYLAVFYSFYWLFLRKETFFQLNRWYLLTTCILPFVFPLLNLKEYFFSPESAQLISLFALETQVISPPIDTGNNLLNSFSGISVVVSIYFSGCLFSFIKLLYRSILIARSLKVSYPGQAYSLFHIIRVDPDLIGYSKIIDHEKVHVKQVHSLDILLIEVIKVFNWFNPLIYSLYRSIKLNHEYIADEVAADRTNERTDYAQLILNQAFGAPFHSETNTFFNESFTKKRITMLFKNKSKKLVLSRFFLLIPILLIIAAFQTKEPALSGIQALGFDNSMAFEVLRTDTGAVFTAVEVSPVPEGGMNAFIQSIADNYVYPKEAKDAKVKGNVVIAFIVERDGHLSNVQVVRDLGYGTGEEAVRVLENSPIWKPGIQNGRTVRVQYTLPILIGKENNSENSGFTSPSPVGQSSPVAQSSQDIIDHLFAAVEEPPAPIVGMSSFLKYVGSNYVYPEEAIKAKVSGRIILSFIVEKDGSLSDIKSIRDLGYGTGEEAVRVLETSSEKWKPGVQNGRAVRVEYNLPIVLNLGTDSE